MLASDQGNHGSFREFLSCMGNQRKIKEINGSVEGIRMVVNCTFSTAFFCQRNEQLLKVCTGRK